MLSVHSCCSPTVSASLTAAPHLRPLQVQLLLPVCVRFSCCSPIVSASADTRHLHPLQNSTAAPCFNCSLIVSTSVAAPRSPIVSASTAIPDCMHPLVAPVGFQPMPGPMHCQCSRHSLWNSRFSKLKYEGRASLV